MLHEPENAGDDNQNYELGGTLITEISELVGTETCEKKDLIKIGILYKGCWWNSSFI